MGMFEESKEVEWSSSHSANMLLTCHQVYAEAHPLRAFLLHLEVQYATLNDLISLPGISCLHRIEVLTLANTLGKPFSFGDFDSLKELRINHYHDGEEDPGFGISSSSRQSALRERSMLTYLVPWTWA